MPAFKLNGVLVFFAAFKKHIGFYPTPSGIEAFKEVQPYASYEMAGKRHVASGKLREGGTSGRQVMERESQEFQERECGEGEYSSIGLQQKFHPQEEEGEPTLQKESIRPRK
jgi:hypothetical protein